MPSSGSTGNCDCCCVLHKLRSHTTDNYTFWYDGNNLSDWTISGGILSCATADSYIPPSGTSLFALGAKVSTFTIDVTGVCYYGAGGVDMHGAPTMLTNPHFIIDGDNGKLKWNGDLAHSIGVTFPCQIQIYHDDLITDSGLSHTQVYVNGEWRFGGPFVIGPAAFMLADGGTIEIVEWIIERRRCHTDCTTWLFHDTCPEQVQVVCSQWANGPNLPPPADWCQSCDLRNGTFVLTRIDPQITGLEGANPARLIKTMWQGAFSLGCSSTHLTLEANGAGEIWLHYSNGAILFGNVNQTSVVGQSTVDGYYTWDRYIKNDTGSTGLFGGEASKSCLASPSAGPQIEITAV